MYHAPSAPCLPVRLQNLSAYVIWFLEQHSMELGKEPEVLTAAKLLAKLAYENKSALQAGLIVAGWDEHRGGQVRGSDCLQTPTGAPFACDSDSDKQI
jgi:20S proteasome alpha/beta subunit